MARFWSKAKGGAFLIARWTNLAAQRCQRTCEGRTYLHLGSHEVFVVAGHCLLICVFTCDAAVAQITS